MAEGRDIGTFGEELPIGAARKRAILECAPICSDLGGIVAEYAQLTSRDKIDILCAKESGSIRIRAAYVEWGVTAGLNMLIEWTHRVFNSHSQSKGTRLCITFRRISSHAEFPQSKWIDLSRFIYVSKSDRMSQADLSYLISRDPHHFWTHRRYNMFVDELDKLIAHIV